MHASTPRLLPRATGQEKAEVRTTIPTTSQKRRRERRKARSQGRGSLGKISRRRAKKRRAGEACRLAGVLKNLKSELPYACIWMLGDRCTDAHQSWTVLASVALHGDNGVGTLHRLLRKVPVCSDYPTTSNAARTCCLSHLLPPKRVGSLSSAEILGPFAR